MLTHDSLAGTAPQRATGITLIDIFSVLLKYRVLIAVLGLGMALMKGIEVIQLPRYYVSDAQFMPQGAAPQSQLAGLARQFGINVGTDGGDTPQFYMDLLKSRSILSEVVTKEYATRTDSGVVRGNLIRIFGLSKLKPREQVPVANAKLADLIGVSVSARTGVITVKVKALTADLAPQIANNLLAEVNTFNLNNRQQRAAAERAFVEKRQAEALAELRTAEGNLQSFLLQNRDFARSPTLALEHNRLTRTVTMRQNVYTALDAAYEQAKIEEVRDLPVITVVAKPEVPLVPESKHGVRKVAFALIIGLVLGAIVAFVLAGLAASTRAHPADIAEFTQLKRDAIDDLKHPWRPLGRLVMRKKGQRAAA